MKVIEISCLVYSLEVWREISNYLDDEVAPALRVRMEAHFKACAHCTAVLDGTKNVVKLVGDGIEHELPEGFGQRLYGKLKDQYVAAVCVAAQQPPSGCGRAAGIPELFFAEVPMTYPPSQFLANIGIVDEEGNLPIA